MKRSMPTTIATISFSAFFTSTMALAGAGNTNPGKTAQTVTSRFDSLTTCGGFGFEPGSDSGSTSIYYWCPWWIESCAAGHASASAFAFMIAEVSADIELTVSQHGNNGAAHQIELDATFANATIQVSASSAGASAWVDAQSADYANAYRSVWADAYSYFASAYASAHGSAFSDSNASAYGYASSGNSSSNASVHDTGVFVRGANIDELEAGLAMSAYNFVSTSASSYASVVTDAYAHASAHAFASAYAQAYALGYHDWDIGYDSYYKNDYSAAHAEAVAIGLANALAIAAYRVSVTARYEDLPGIRDDVLEIVTVNSGMLYCGVGSGTWAYANAISD